MIYVSLIVFLGLICKGVRVMKDWLVIVDEEVILGRNIWPWAIVLMLIFLRHFAFYIWVIFWFHDIWFGRLNESNELPQFKSKIILSSFDLNN